MDLKLKDRVAFITGGSSGIGRATALAFAREGAHVAIADVTPEGEDTAALCRKLGVKSIFQKCDVSSDEDVRKAIERSANEFGRLDFAFNNAGIEGTPASTVDCPIANWNRVIDINLKGVWLCMKYEIPEMLKSGCGAIVNCSSIAGLTGFKAVPAYVASKHGVIGLTQTAALEFAQSKIRVNAVCPGIIQTPMIDRFTSGSADALQALKAGEPIGRIGQPEEVADAVLWLCSERASFITGQALAIDGGWVAQ